MALILPLPDGTAVERLRGELIARWGEPHRRYHDLDHLRAVLAALEPLIGQAPDPVAVTLAAWFHDAVYDGVPGADEEASAALAEERLPGCGVAPALVAEVARLVRVTAGHSYEPDDANAAVLCDADLAVLGSPEPVYRAYAAAVRQEYRHVPDELFAAGRAAVLRGLLAGPRLFGTEPGRALWEGQARENLRAELDRLTPGSAG
ncbi:HD domain-containing protein [Rhizohabitans arisaemae]|uniref:HD domain-containing protein n=1 Tax=Rhizohabitans arisaemae TaxID=2720610 RepID=UPI0024B1152D|nr:metal-dependent phosphohydrolase [Rhizohabitans arisaemae]